MTLTGKCSEGHEITLSKDCDDISGEMGTQTIAKLPGQWPGEIKVACPACEAQVWQMINDAGWRN